MGLALGVVLAFAQQRGPQPVPTAPSNPTAPTAPGYPNTLPPPGSQPQYGVPEFQRPIFLSGKVMMDDGTPPPDPVVIQRVCNGRARPEGYTDSKGRFSFQLGQNLSVLPDASVGRGDYTPNSSNLGINPATGVGVGSSEELERALMNCELRADLPGFRSDSVTLAGRRALDNPELGVIVLHRIGNVEGLTISATSLMAPKDARKAYEKGLETLKKNKPDDAQKDFQKAVDIYPKYASAWFQLGLVYQEKKRLDEARKAYGSALAADAKFVSPYMQLAEMSAQEQKWQDVADTTDRVLKLNAISFPRAYFFNAVANYELHKLDPAEKNALEAQKLDTGHQFPQIEHLLGVILAEKRDFKGAAASFKSYLALVPTAKDADTVRKQLAEVEKFVQAADASHPQ